MQLSTFSAMILAKMLCKKKHSNIKILNIQSNNIGDMGTKLVSTFISKNKTLISLNLSSNNITSLGS